MRCWPFHGCRRPTSPTTGRPVPAGRLAAPAPGGRQLISPRTRLQEHELNVLMAGTLEHAVEHGLGTAEPLPPRERYEDAHAMAVAVTSIAALGSSKVRQNNIQAPCKDLRA